MEELKDLHQINSVEDYIERFEGLRTRLLLENRMFTEVDFMDAFIGGLKGKLRSFMKIFRPQSLDDTYDYALQMESALDSQFKRLRIQVKPAPPLNSASKPISNAITIKSALLDQIRLLGLCFKCGEKYFPGHQCKVKVQMLLGQN
jgi:hypothetical protein